MRKKTNKIAELKQCPFRDDRCLGAECMIFHEQFGRCHIELLTTNLYKVSCAIQDLEEQLPPVRN
ncbi:MAG: hypothetical protein HGA96_00205 [Desulfobulbaceae bacterium]|nr:hypothetical protein [Desulfobulbaceae bacterium]